MKLFLFISFLPVLAMFSNNSEMTEKSRNVSVFRSYKLVQKVIKLCPYLSQRKCHILHSFSQPVTKMSQNCWTQTIKQKCHKNDKFDLMFLIWSWYVFFAHTALLLVGQALSTCSYAPQCNAAQQTTTLFMLSRHEGMHIMRPTDQMLLLSSKLSFIVNKIMSKTLYLPKYTPNFLAKVLFKFST